MNNRLCLTKQKISIERNYEKEPNRKSGVEKYKN